MTKPKITVKFDFSIGARFLAFTENLEHVPQFVQHVLLDTMTATLLNAIETRYQLQRSNMADYETQDPWPDPNNERIAVVLAALEKAQDRRAEMFRVVMDEIVKPDNIVVSVEDGGNTMQASVGYIPLLDTIKSPSATEYLTGKESRSPYGILWRQMEFGMGAYRKPSDLPVIPTRYTSSRGGWWYGRKKPGTGVPFRGVSPGNLLRNAAGLPYSEDAEAFFALFVERMTALL